uniref:Fucosyltransferase n=1 Tax=Parastrongyloides trichosuri TaxID=131310 RepID=A0A0N4ZSC0_PARTI
MKYLLIILLQFLILIDSKGKSKNKKKSLYTIISWNSRYWEDFGVCEKYNCLFTNDRNKLKDADAVLFNDFFYRPRDKKNLIKRPKKSTLFINVFTESYIRSSQHAKRFKYTYPKDYFNLTYTYLPYGDIYWSYGNTTMYIDKNITTEQLKIEKLNLEKKFENKNKQIIWLVSNCVTPSGRMKAVKALKKYINVTQYGKCNNKVFDLPEEGKNKIFEKHYFYIASENTDCKNYITEKLFERISLSTIPIVSVRKLYDNYAPPNSFIAMDDFKNPQEMSEYLISLTKDKEKYLQYFSYRDKGWRQRNITLNKRCFICSEIIKFHKSKKNKTYYDIKKWVKESNKCLPQQYIPTLWNITHI